jgi:branched-chain amino acid transport system ATP-binding protein
MPEPILTLTGVSAYYGSLCSVRDIDLTIEAGETVCVIGPNGAGKTTLLKAISGMLGKTTGRIDYLGRDARQMTPQQLVAAGLIHVPEGRRVFYTLSVAENLKIGGFQQRGDDIADRIERVFALFPRLRERRSQAAGSLSGGEQQMLAIGRALVGKPRLLMLDEPSMGLAPIIVAEIYKEIRQLRAMGVTVLLVEQNAKIALEIADRAIVLNAGELRYAGSCADLTNDADFQRLIFGA